jgi:hypothetical protein
VPQEANSVDAIAAEAPIQAGKAYRAQVDDGLEILIEVADPVAEVSPQAGPGGRLAGARTEKAIHQLHEVGRAIGVTCKNLYAHTRENLAEHAPDELTLEFGLKFTGEAGLILSKASGEASLVIKATWKKGAPEAATPAGASK